MLRGEACGLKKYIKIIHLKPLADFEYFHEKKVRLLDGSFGRAFLLDPNFAQGAELLAP